jgi:hypothetical protein
MEHLKELWQLEMNKFTSEIAKGKDKESKKFLRDLYAIKPAKVHAILTAWLQ